MADISAELLERNGLTGDDISWLVLHQANSCASLMLQPTAWDCPKKNGHDQYFQIREYHSRNHTTLFMGMGKPVKEKRENIVLAAFGGGFTWGATLVKWALLIMNEELPIMN